ncbi:MAG TPA: hypothetical protein VFZ76_10590 [Anaerolineales bacterium]
MNMNIPNRLGLPHNILQVAARSMTVEYASLTKAGVPITFPVTPYIGEDGGTFDVTTGLTYSAKAERARKNAKVCLLYSEPLGSGLANPPVVLVYGLATVRDADLQANTDRYVRLALERFAEAYGRMPGFFLKTMAWYFARIWIKVTPMKILWWPGGDLSQAPNVWQSAEGTKAPPSDPSPAGKPLKRWDDPPQGWRREAEYVVKSIPEPVVTCVDSNGYPVPFRTQKASLKPEGFHLTLWPSIPETAQGKACLTFHRHDERFTWQENVVFVGQVSGNSEAVVFKVDRRITSVSFSEASQLQTMLYMLRLRSKLAPRLKAEAERRGQPVPVIRLA